MKLKVYADRMSQPSRAVIIFCKVNGIDFEEIRVDLSKRQQLSPEFKEINPMRRVPAIVDGRFKLFERYPADVSRKAKIHSVLDWHHSNLRQGAAGLILNSVLAPVFGLPLNSQAAAISEKLLSLSLSKIESIWLKGNGRFLLGGFLPSIADLSLVCEILQLELLDEKDRSRILGPHKKVQQWIEDTRNATRPHFDEVHNVLYKAKTKFQVQRSVAANSERESSIKKVLPSKM
ncbi:glutathione S-transferase T1 isoform X2 [Alnus glutinosa]|uniref:glutathione S-transferase T1 isoform X2 n=1 Tax=Alnus glutinosa TaxID=3517 RepID=UPI002D767950|nr:glutathione S-transferase T1 isoform X2 [Alnus glutinosa]